MVDRQWLTKEMNKLSFTTYSSNMNIKEKQNCLFATSVNVRMIQTSINCHIHVHGY